MPARVWPPATRPNSEACLIALTVSVPALARAIASAVLGSLNEAVHVRDNDEIGLSASVGIAQIRGTADTTLQRAELAVVHAKARGRGRIESGDTLPEARRRSA